MKPAEQRVQGLGCGFEVGRRIARGEIAYAHDLLCALREKIAAMDELICERLPKSAPLAQLEARGTPGLADALAQPYVDGAPARMTAALGSLMDLFQRTRSKLRARHPNDDREAQERRAVEAFARELPALGHPRAHSHD